MYAVDYLISVGANVNSRDKDRATVFTAAGGTQICAEVVELIGETGEYIPNQVDAWGKTGIEYAGSKGNWGCADLMDDVGELCKCRSYCSSACSDAYSRYGH